MSHLLFENDGLIVAKKLPDKIDKQIDKAGLPRGGTIPFDPKLEKNKKGKQVIKKGTVTHGPKKGKMGTLTRKGGYGSKTGRTQAIPITGMYKKMAEKSTFGSIRKVICYPS